MITPRTPYHNRTTSNFSSSSSPSRSSPLNPNYKTVNPPSQRRASFKTQYQTQSRYTRAPAPIQLTSGSANESEETPQKLLWRAQFRQKFVERSGRDRSNYRERKRNEGGLSSANDIDEGEDGADMEEDGLDEMDDELYRRLMLSDHQKEVHAQSRSYTLAVGSSLDPDMDNFEDLERELSGAEPRSPSPPPDFFMDDIDDMMPSNDSADIHIHDPYGDVNMDLSSPPSSPVQPHARLLPQQSPFVSYLLSSACPYCNAPYSLHEHGESAQPTLICAVCTSILALGDAPMSWAEAHPFSTSSHMPLAGRDSLADGVVILCSDESCSWGIFL